MLYFHPKSAASLFLASLTLLATSTPLPVGAADTGVDLRQLTHKNFNSSVAHDTWYVSHHERPQSRLSLGVAVAVGDVFAHTSRR